MLRNHSITYEQRELALSLPFESSPQLFGVNRHIYVAVKHVFTDLLIVSISRKKKLGQERFFHVALTFQAIPVFISIFDSDGEIFFPLSPKKEVEAGEHEEHTKHTALREQVIRTRKEVICQDKRQPIYMFMISRQVVMCRKHNPSYKN